VTLLRATGLLALALAGSGCGRQELDLLVQSKVDPCLAFTDEAACDEHAALGCSYQPNPDGCTVDEPSCTAGTCKSGDPYVRRVERSFFLNGEPFRFVGVSSWALLLPDPCTTIPVAEREAWVESAYTSLVPARAKVARLYAFQSSAGATGEDFTLFDAAVRGARRAGVRLQFVLEHSAGDCSQGTQRDDAWYRDGYKIPDGNYAKSYRDFAASLATRYHDEPTVLGYVLMSGLGPAEEGALTGFVTDVGQLLRGLAPSQLISLDANPTLNVEGGAVFRRLQELSAVDFVDVDDYDFAEPERPLDEWLLSLLGQLEKPVVVGEGAFQLDGSDAASLARRADRARRRMAAWKAWGFDGALFWAYQPGWAGVSEEFDARAGDPMLSPGGVLDSAPW
jgi:mannan endo-1,4-beta-mannosidase